MKRKIVFFALIISVGACTVLSSCAFQKKTEESGTQNTEQSEPTQEQAELQEKEEDEAKEDVNDLIYTWQEITVTFPEDWTDKYILLENENGFSVYQKSSYEMDENTGYLCGFNRTSDYINYGAGETILAYTDQGVCYYMTQPTDVACYYEDEDILDEYSEMCSEILEVAASAQIVTDGIHMDADEYILPISSIEALDEEVLSNLSDNELMIARNEIYARHGRTFQNEYLQNYFNSCSWYQGTITPEEFDESVFSEIEKNNLILLTEKEDEYATEHPYPKSYSYGTIVEEDLNCDGTVEQIFVSLMEQSDGCYVPIVTIDGKAFDISDTCQLVTPVTDLFYVSDISSYDDELELAFLDYGASCDPVTYFYRYDGTLELVGSMDGFPFKDQNEGINGFNNQNGIIGRIRTDLIETAYLEGYWWLNIETHTLEHEETGLYSFIPSKSHQLYENLTVHVTMDEDSAEIVIPKQEEVYFMKSDLEEWILVKGKDGTKGYMHIKNGKVTDLGKSANNVFSDLEYFD